MYICGVYQAYALQQTNSYEDERKWSSFQSMFCSALIPEATAVPSIFYHGFVWPVTECHGKEFVWYVLLM